MTWHKHWSKATPVWRKYVADWYRKEVHKVISLLNSFSGVAAAMAGFVISNSALIIGGALVGAAGFILTVLMGEAMNRTIANVLFSGFGATVAGPVSTADKPVKSATPEDVAIALAYAQNVMVVPGYGLAVAQAQHAVRELASILEDKGVSVNYAIHPVAGRMPGHMNVLLAEADGEPRQRLLEDRFGPERERDRSRRAGDGASRHDDPSVLVCAQGLRRSYPLPGRQATREVLRGLIALIRDPNARPPGEE